MIDDGMNQPGATPSRRTLEAECERLVAAYPEAANLTKPTVAFIARALRGDRDTIDIISALLVMTNEGAHVVGKRRLALCAELCAILDAHGSIDGYGVRDLLWQVQREGLPGQAAVTQEKARFYWGRG